MENEKQTFKEIVEMITSACNAHFVNGTRDIRHTVVECATQIYIAQMKGEYYGIHKT